MTEDQLKEMKAALKSEEFRNVEKRLLIESSVDGVLISSLFNRKSLEKATTEEIIALLKQVPSMLKRADEIDRERYRIIKKNKTFIQKILSYL